MQEMTISALIRQCADTAKSKGFWDSHKARARAVIEQEVFGKTGSLDDEEYHQFKYVTPGGTELFADEVDHVIDHILDTLEKEMVLGDPTIFLALMLTEIGEAIEALRKGNYRGKDGVLEEVADTFIRGFDWVGRFSKLMGSSPEEFSEILVKKMEYNKTRPSLHDKDF